MPPGFDRAARVRLIGECAHALMRGELPGDAARLFVAGALVAWLEAGGRCGSLERDYLRVTQRERSRLTPQRLYARCASTATPDGEAGTMPSSDDASLDGEQADDPDD